MTPLMTQFKLLLTLQMLELRKGWVVTLIFSMLVPLIMVFGLGLIGSGQTREGLLYIVSGSAVMALITLGVVSLAQEFAQLRQSGTFTYYSSLPIKVPVLFGALLATRVALQIPGLLVTVLGGDLIYGLHLKFSWWLLAVVPLSIFALSGLGALIGTYLAPGIVPIVASGSLFLLLFVSPVLIPIANLPAAMQWFGYLLPPSYAAAAIRISIGYGSTDGLLVPVVVLALFSALSLFFVCRKITVNPR